MSLVKFELPEEFDGVTYKKILAGMLAKISDEYDKTEGGFVHDMIAPTALEVDELIQFWLALGIKTNFHMWASGKWLDMHAHDCGLVRKPATPAYVDLTVVTTGAVRFPKGFIFSVPSDDNNPAIDFEATETYRFTEAGTYTVYVKAVNVGTGGNVAADSITLMKNPVKNVASVTNLNAASGGVEAEGDESLRERIDAFYAGHGASYVGNRADYERWAREVPGVGFAHCVPTYAGANSVRLIIADENGDGANQTILRNVETYIFGTGHDDVKRLAPIGVTTYEVIAPSPQKVYISLEAKLATSSSVAAVKKRIVKAISNHLQSLSDDNNSYGELRYMKVAALITSVTGIEDFRNFKLNGTTNNLIFTEEQVPVIQESYITITEY